MKKSIYKCTHLLLFLLLFSFLLCSKHGPTSTRTATSKCRGATAGIPHFHASLTHTSSTRTGHTTLYMNPGGIACQTDPPPGADLLLSALRSPRRTYSSNGRRNRSPSPLARELLNGGRNAFSSEDAVTPLSTTGSCAGYHFGSGEGTPTPLSISQSLKARIGYSFNGGGDSTAMPAALPLVSPTGDEGPASTGFSSTAASGGTTATTAGGAATASASNAAAANAANANAIPTFSEITRGAIDRNGAVPLEPFARARVRAVEEGWARWAADRREREKRWRIRMLSVVTFLVLVAVLVCRRIGVGKWSFGFETNTVHEEAFGLGL